MGTIKGDTRSLDYSSFNSTWLEFGIFIIVGAEIPFLFTKGIHISLD